MSRQCQDNLWVLSEQCLRSVWMFLIWPQKGTTSRKGISMLLAAKFGFDCCCLHAQKEVLFSSKQIVRLASALPKARPNKDEVVKVETKILKKNPGNGKSNLFAAPVCSLFIKQLSSASVEVPNKKISKDTDPETWKKMAPNNILSVYLQLSKHRLTMLITASTACGFLISGVPFSLSSFGACVIGTALLSASANTCNHLLEAPYDAQMKRTQFRVLVIHRISPLHAFAFASVTAAAGLGFICLGCNSLTAGLGLLNLLLYVGVYTPMKRYHIGCTWVGAINGAIPPLMGYTAASGTLDLAALTLGAILFSWQFPHFNALSWNLRGDYSRAGYHVMCVTNEELCRRTTLRHSVAVLALCSVVAPLTNLTTYVFALDSIPPNLIMVYLAYKFYRRPDESNAKTLFYYSLLHLPILMALMVISNVSRSPDQRKRKKKSSLANEILGTLS